jgi:hypothetical protein
MVSPKKSLGVQNIKNGPFALGTAENESGSAKHEKVPDTLRTAENEFGSIKHENGTQRPRYRRKHVRLRKTRKRDPTLSVPPKTSPGAQNMKTGPNALGTVENMSSSGKQENGTRRPRYRRKRDETPSVPPKMRPDAQNMKMRPDALGTAENESGHAKHENGTRRPRYRQKRVRES